MSASVCYADNVRGQVLKLMKERVYYLEHGAASFEMRVMRLLKIEMIKIAEKDHGSRFNKDELEFLKNHLEIEISSPISMSTTNQDGDYFSWYETDVTIWLFDGDLIKGRVPVLARANYGSNRQSEDIAGELSRCLVKAVDQFANHLQNKKIK
jgi:hypothetical protein